MHIHDGFESEFSDFMTASDVMTECIRKSQALMGTKIGPDLHKKIVSILSNILKGQATIRSLPVSPIVSLANDIVVEISNHSVILRVSSGWMDDLDELLLTRICKSCGCTIPGRPHPASECHEAQACQVMEA